MEDLIGRAQSGDRDALERVLADAAPIVLRFARRMCKSAADADDVLQETLWSAATHLGQFEGRSSLSSWLFTLARSACTRKRRGLANRAHGELDAAQPAPGPDPEANAESRELAGVLERALGALSDEHREVLLLRDVEGLSAPEAAQVVGIGVDALKSRLHRARGALREAFWQHVTPRSPECPDAVWALSRKLEGELSTQDCAEMEKHVSACPSCGAACAELKSALGACAHANDDEVSPETRARLERALAGLRARIGESFPAPDGSHRSR